MSLIPVFEIGLWNAWILILGMASIHFGLSYLIVDRKAALFIWPPYNKKEKKLSNILTAAYFAPWVYAIFVPLKLGTAWFYAGLSVYLLGMIFATMGLIVFAVTPLDRPNTSGVYRISRNPLDFGAFLIFVGIGVACASWIFLLDAMALISLQSVLVMSEERMCLEKYGDAYREYMNRTPKWIGIPRSRKK